MRATMVGAWALLGLSCGGPRDGCAPAGTWLVVDAGPVCDGEPCVALALDPDERDAFTVTVHDAGAVLHWMEPGPDSRRIERKGNLDRATCEVVLVGPATSKDSATRRLRFRGDELQGSRTQVGSEGGGLYLVSWHSTGARL